MRSYTLAHSISFILQYLSILVSHRAAGGQPIPAADGQQLPRLRQPNRCL